MVAMAHAEFEGKLRESGASSSRGGSSCFICSIWRLTWYPAKRRRRERRREGKKKTSSVVWAEEKPRILSVLKFDSEVQDPGRQKASEGGGKAGRDGPRKLFYFFIFSETWLGRLSKHVATVGPK